VNSRECVLAALRREKPSWVPIFEWLVDRHVREALCPGSDALGFAEHAGWDAVVVYADDHPSTEGQTQYVDEWGLTVRRATEEYPVVVGHPIKSIRDLESFVPPNPLETWHFRTLRRAVDRFGGEKAIVFRLRDAYSLPRYLVGMENLMILMATESQFVQKLVDLSVDYYVAMARHAATLGADVFWTSDDYCDNRGPVMGSQRWRLLCLPGLQRLIREVKELGKPLIKHCDGNINPIVEDLVAAGIDGLDPIDVGAGVDLADIKTRFVDRVAIKGGVPVTLLCQGSPQQVRTCVKQCLDVAGPEGYILSSTSDITASVKPENYAAMLAAWREFR
jgi:uroporphyrinogen decarboxylase